MEKIDFKGIKEAVRPESVFTFLGLTMKPSPTNADVLRGPCPVCKRGGARALAYTISKKMWSCQGMCQPDAGRKNLFGDIIRLVAHVRGISQPDAAILLRGTFLGEPEKPKASKSSQRKTAKPRAASKASKAVGGIEAPGGEYSIVDYLQQFS